MSKVVGMTFGHVHADNREFTKAWSGDIVADYLRRKLEPAIDKLFIDCTWQEQGPPTLSKTAISGLKAGDVIVAVDSYQVDSRLDLAMCCRAALERELDEVKVPVLRSEKEVEVTLKRPVLAQR